MFERGYIAGTEMEKYQFLAYLRTFKILGEVSGYPGGRYYIAYNASDAVFERIKNNFIVNPCDCCCPHSLECPHANSFRRLPRALGGLGLCKNLK